MHYISADEAAAKWRVSSRQVQRLLATGRIPAAKKLGRAWMIPGHVTKPGAPCFEKKASQEQLAADLAGIIERTTLSWPLMKPDSILDRLHEPRLRLQVEGEFAYLRGDHARVAQCFRQLRDDEAAKLRACALTIAGAISMGDSPLYLEVETFLKQVIQKNSHNAQISTFAELCLATGYTGAMAPNMLPQWLKNGIFSALPPKARLDAVYKRTKYFRCLGKYESMLDIAQTALNFCESEEKFSFHSIYLRVTCAIACVHLGRQKEAMDWLVGTLQFSLPHGFITPFAESAPAFGGLLEQVLEREYPEYLKSTKRQWQATAAHWTTFHNQFTGDNISSILNLREYEIATLVAHRVPRTAIARQFYVSPGRLNNIIKGIYAKLLVSGRDELAQYVL